MEATKSTLLQPDLGLALVAARDGRLWLSFGSFSPGGIAVVELNATTGALTDAALSQCGAAVPYCVGSAVNVANRWCRTHDGPANASRTWCPPSSRLVDGDCVPRTV